MPHDTFEEQAYGEGFITRELFVPERFRQEPWSVKRGIHLSPFSSPPSELVSTWVELRGLGLQFRTSHVALLLKGSRPAFDQR